MIIPPRSVSGRSVVEVVAQRLQRWTQARWAPCSWPSPSAPPAPVPATPAAPNDRLSALAASDGAVTDHALLVLLGQFAQHLGLVQLLEAVPIAQKTVEHRPQTKLIEFLVAILAGVGQLQELNDAPRALVRDTAVQAAWGQPGFAHYSGVSRTLAAADASTLQAVLDVLAQVSRPFIDREVLALLRTNQSVIVDIDLTGREVSPSSTDYPDAAFGWMDDAVAKGYQSAISSLSAGPSGRLLLSTQRYDGRTKSAECLRAALVAVEQALGVRPQRRSALVQAQLSTLAERLAAQQQALAQLQTQRAEAQREGELLNQGAQALDARRLRQRARLEKQIERAERQASSLAQQIAQVQAQQAELSSWLSQLQADNATLGARVRVVIRLDAGFATDANLAYLIELGYTVLTKAHSGHTTKRLQRSIAEEAVWERVGANAEALALGPQRIGEGRYALEALQVRYQLPEGERHTTLLYYGEQPPAPAASWFGAYNARQTAEAGIKENKGVFSMRRPLVRSRYGMQLQEQFALFAANFVRWAAAWAGEQLRDVPLALAQALKEVKTLVRVLAHSRARLVETEVGCVLVFDAHSPFAGAVLPIRGQVVYQNVLPLFTSAAITPPRVT